MHGNGLPEALRHWTMSGIFRARSGFPVDVIEQPAAAGAGFRQRRAPGPGTGSAGVDRG